MSAETLRKAAALMRERAEAATPGPWEISSGGTWIWGDLGVCVYAPHHDDGEDCDVPHIASWQPDVALAAAELLGAVGVLLDQRHLSAEIRESVVRDAAADFARTYLGEVSR